jgi:TPR repeat protein
MSSFEEHEASANNCLVCDNPSSLRCSRCLGAHYCSKVCQSKNWKKHKAQCAEASEIVRHLNESGVRTLEEVEAHLEDVKRNAALGDPASLFNMGLSLNSGLGVRMNKKEALKLVKKAADLEFVEAMLSLGAAYAKGDYFGVAVDEAESFDWYHHAAESGNVRAAHNIAHCYSKGDGTSINKTKAAHWFRWAAEQGNACSGHNLAAALKKGDGVIQDEVEAFKWMKMSAEAGHELAQHDLAHLYDSGSLTVPVDKVKAAFWFKKAADNGNLCSLHYLGMFYISGSGLKMNKALGLQLITQAAQKEHKPSIAYLAAPTNK